MYDVSDRVIYSILRKFPNRRKKKSYKNFSNELRTENNFEFESAIFLTIEIL